MSYAQAMRRLDEAIVAQALRELREESPAERAYSVPAEAVEAAREARLRRVADAAVAARRGRERLRLQRQEWMR